MVTGRLIKGSFVVKNRLILFYIPSHVSVRWLCRLILIKMQFILIDMLQCN